MIITPENKIVLEKRLQSFLWRLGMMILAGIVQLALDNLDLINLSPTITVMLGLILGEVSKFLNSRST